MLAIDDRQQALDLRVIHENLELVESRFIDNLDSMTSAIGLCVSLSGRQDKAIASEISIEAAQWSRIKTGMAHFPTNKYKELIELCGNLAPLQYLANSLGYEIKKKQSHLEEENESLKLQLNALKGLLKS